MLAAATVSTLAATGLTQGALVYSNSQAAKLPQASIGYIGPVPVRQATVATGNVFDIAVVGFDLSGNSSGGLVVNDAAFLVGPFTPTFGTTQTDTGATSDGETATITSTETVSGGTTTDKVTFSVPTRFVPVGTTFSDGDLINEEDLEIGFDAGPTPLTFSVPVTTAITATGSAKYKTGGRSATYTFAAGGVYTSLDPTDTMLSADEGLLTAATSNGSGYTIYTATDLTKYNFSSFSFTFSYSTPTAVPEPGTAAVGLILGVGLLKRRNRRTVASSHVDLSTGLIENPEALADDGRASAFAIDQVGNQNRLLSGGGQI
jgi:hypothetical protein